ncbi:hypothetical protein BJY00DRAFT_141182 [Aspergillus carlsbadensis]|nr:hypothetical protein BJY00DRAFT_141182 [Aspergillus carlsbadensis]
MHRAMQAAKQSEVSDSPELSAGVSMAIEPFILTHHDLAPRNVMVSPSGQLSLIDWDLAGFYPVRFEYAAMYNFHVPQDWGPMARWRWHLFAWIAVGYYEADARLLRIMRSKFTRCAVGRRFVLLANGGPSAYPVT